MHWLGWWLTWMVSTVVPSPSWTMNRSDSDSCILAAAVEQSNQLPSLQRKLCQRTGSGKSFSWLLSYRGLEVDLHQHSSTPAFILHDLENQRPETMFNEPQPPLGQVRYTRMGASIPVYLAAVLKYLGAEIL
jgi:hypothetical protein